MHPLAPGEQNSRVADGGFCTLAVTLAMIRTFGLFGGFFSSRICSVQPHDSGLESGGVGGSDARFPFVPRCNDVAGEPQYPEQPDDVIVDIDLPPPVLDRGARRIGVMVIVPSLAASQDRDEPVVPAVVRGLVTSITENVAD